VSFDVRTDVRLDVRIDGILDVSFVAKSEGVKRA